MKFFPNKILKNHKGLTLLDGKTEEASVPLTLGNLAVEALLRELPQDNNAPGNTKLQRWKLAEKIQKHSVTLQSQNYLAEELRADDFVLLAVEDVNLIKSRILQGFPAIVAGPGVIAIEGDISAAEPAAERA